jgi:hypothetical protein
MKMQRIAAVLAIAVLWLACDERTPVGPEISEVAGVLLKKADPLPAEQQTAGAENTAEILYACYNPSGSVYRIKAPGLPDECHGKHVEFSWNEQGPQGLTGDKGEKGELGRMSAHERW